MSSSDRMPASSVPFDADRLDRLMDEAGLDVLIATSKHNVQYLLGGHRAFFFDYMDAMGLSRYLPVFVYVKGAPDKAAYFGHRLESFQRRTSRSGCPAGGDNSSGSVDTMQKAVDYLRDARRGQAHRRRARVPADGCGLGACGAASARSRMRPSCSSACARSSRRRNWRLLRIASERVIDSMLAVIAKPRSRPHQGGTDRSAAARGNDPRPDLRILPDHRRHQPQPRAVEPEVGQGRHPLARFRRQLSRLYRRSVPHGHSGRAGRRARGHAGRDRGDPARLDEADQGRRHGAASSMARPSRWCASPSTTTTCTSSPTAWD